jgi:hypothetical protein
MTNPRASATTSHVHMLCADPSCTHVITLGMSETMEEAWAADPGYRVLDGPHRSEIICAIQSAAAILGWRREVTDAGEIKIRCPSHTWGLVCARCRFKPPACACVGGPSFNAVRLTELGPVRTASPPGPPGR